MSEKPDYIGMIRTQVRLFWAWLFLMVLVPIAAWFWPWVPEGETAASFFQRSGSVLLAIGLLAELAAVRVYSILNPSGYVTTGFKGAAERYGKYPARMTYAVLVAVALGTLISGYGDLLNNASDAKSVSSNYEDGGVGMFGTVFSGVLVFVLGQVVLKFVIEPVHAVKEEIGLLENTFLKNSTSRNGFLVNGETASDFKNHCAMILTARRRVPWMEVLHRAYSLPSNKEIDLGVAALKSAINLIESERDAMKERGEEEMEMYEDKALVPLFRQVGDSFGVNVTYSDLMNRVVKQG